MPRGRKRTTGKYQTVEELEDMVQFFWKTQGEAQTARSCGVSPTTVKNILERVKERHRNEPNRRNAQGNNSFTGSFLRRTRGHAG